MSNLTKIEQYNFSYRGVVVHIHRALSEQEMLLYHFPVKWTYYIHINLDRLVDSELAKSLWMELKSSYINKSPYRFYPYANHPFLDGLDFHGGISYYSKLFLLNDEPMIKIGCDYMHLFDEGVDYSLDRIIADAKHTIDDFHSKTQYSGCNSSFFRSKSLAKIC